MRSYPPRDGGRGFGGGRGGPRDDRGGGGGFRGDRGGFRGGSGGDRDRGFQRRPPYGGGGPSIDYKSLVEFVARSVAEKPKEVRVMAFERGRGTLAIKIKMADDDVGRLIGKSGRNIEALRMLVRVASLRERRRVFVDLATQRPDGR